MSGQPLDYLEQLEDFSCNVLSIIGGQILGYNIGAVTSTLHQMLKYPVKGKIVTVRGEEEYMVSHLNSFRYMDMDEEFIETPCHNFKEVCHTLASTEIAIEEPPMKMASLKDARAVIEKEAQRVVRRARIGRPPLRISNPGVNAIEDDDEESDIDSWIYPTTNGGLNNWTTKDFVSVSFITQ